MNMMVENYIRTILFERKQAVVAGLGTLEYVHRSAWSSREPDGSTKLCPPREELVFTADENAAFDNGLSELIARREHLSIADAKRIISEYAKHVRSRLDAEGKYAMEGVGIFFLERAGVSFRADEGGESRLPVLHEVIVYQI